MWISYSQTADRADDLSRYDTLFHRRNAAMFEVQLGPRSFGADSGAVRAVPKDTGSALSFALALGLL